MKARTKWILRGAGLIIIVWFVVAYVQSLYQQPPSYLASGNGRIEAVEMNLSTPRPGRVQDVYVREGEWVEAGQLLAVLDTAALTAQLHQAEAQLLQAQSQVAAAQSQIALREAEHRAAQAVLQQRQAELELATIRYQRAEQLARQGSVSAQELDDARAAKLGAEAAIAATQAQIAAADAAIIAAQTNVRGSEASVEAALASVESMLVELAESEIRAPRPGRVQFIMARPGEVIGAGGRVLNLMDVTDVYMTFFLPTAVVGKLAIGSEARIVLDTAPDYVIPATISFIADEAQFTPKTVETAAERDKLMFRVRAQIPRALLERYIEHVKTGLPGVTYVRTDTAQPWPDHLQLLEQVDE
ncbi:hypothetical protein IDAT_08260 [Pseudidiomarina atlantica]|jgi:HlyD family secretion protein|uniref:Multidrug resistance protein MdtA-like alpha-helical hairpin domain-containing protein n=1 Tax=Pseudidiomarina atlantica TaxID=1517416 RepID=A0A094ISB4_9GAMM|nr:HlyD family efflux transporter periplasmic adaptor subunit [Pseudidiomarina atlantica]KFZ28724.1 hypothetical protein IDAT_08260 [Pseudidiomarina atlantica]